jgi:bacteriorhodopsin
MMIDPVEVLKKTTKSLLVPTSTSTPHPSDTAFPTIIPNPPTFQHADASGYRTLWAVFVIMVLASASFAALAWTVPVSRRLYHVLTTLITIIAALSYYGMATKQGTTYHHINKTHHHNKGIPPTHEDIFRQVFWARYVDWALTTPLLLVDLSLLAGLSGAHMTMAILADVIMILTGLFAAFAVGTGGQKWGWYAIACISFLVVIWHLGVNGRTAVSSKGAGTSKFYAMIAGYTVLVWLAYPIIWGVADGSRILSVNQEIIAYAVLDILAKPVFGVWLLAAHARLPETNVELGGFWTYGVGSEGRIRVGDDDEGA